MVTRTTTIIRFPDGTELECNFPVTLRCLTHQYTTSRDEQVIVIDEPIADITITGQGRQG